MTKITAALTGIAGYVPKDVLTNADLEQMVDTTDAWITTRTGIKQRHILKGQNQGSSVMGIEAVKDLLHKTNTDPKTIDLLICATITPDLIIPATSHTIAHAVGITNAFSYDLQAACSGFLYALVTGAQFIETRKYQKVIVVGVDKMSSMVDYKDRSTCILFGDGAGAALLEPNTTGLGLIDSVLAADGGSENVLYQKAGGSRYPTTHQTIDAGQHYLYQDGRAVFKVAVTKLTEVSQMLMQRHGLTPENLTYFVPHQANIRIIQAVAQNLEIPLEKVMLTIQSFGNTTNATIPLCLWRYADQLKKGDQLLLATFGGGLTWGAAYLKWAYDGA